MHHYQLILSNNNIYYDFILNSEKPDIFNELSSAVQAKGFPIHIVKIDNQIIGKFDGFMEPEEFLKSAVSIVNLYTDSITKNEN